MRAFVTSVCAGTMLRNRVVKEKYINMSDIKSQGKNL